MKAIVQHAYGSPDVLTFEEVSKPAVKDDEVLVRVAAASVNAYDWHSLTGLPYVIRLMNGVRKPRSRVPGVDVAGQVEAVGRDITGFQPGDEVFGMRTGAYAEYVSVRERLIVPKPANVTFEQAAAVPMAALTALQGLRDKGKVARGQQVLVNGASGGVGTFAVQIAKSFGADVTGVCSTRNMDMVRSIGADQVIDYTNEDFAESGKVYDLIIDIVGNHSPAALKRAMSAHGTLVAVGGPDTNRWVGGLTFSLKVFLASRVGPKKMVSMLTKNSKADLVTLQKLLEAGDVTPVIDRTYPLSEVPQALAYVGEGHTRGKVVITV